MDSGYDIGTADATYIAVLVFLSAVVYAISLSEPLVLVKVVGLVLRPYLDSPYLTWKGYLFRAGLRRSLPVYLAPGLVLACSSSLPYPKPLSFCSLDGAGVDSMQCRVFSTLWTFVVYLFWFICLSFRVWVQACMFFIALLTVTVVGTLLASSLAPDMQYLGFARRKPLTKAPRKKNDDTAHRRPTDHHTSMAGLGQDCGADEYPSNATRGDSEPQGSDISDAGTYEEILSEKFPEGYTVQRAFLDRYKLETKLSRQGHEFTFQARQRSTGLLVAVKIFLKNDVTRGWSEHSKFGTVPHDVAIKNTVQHESIIASLEVFHDTLFTYVIEEFHSHDTLLAYISDHGFVPAAQAKSIFLQLVSAVDHLHTQGISHGDIEPDVILIDDQLKVKLTSFGRARRIPSDWTGRRREFCVESTRFGGTPPYAPPEIHRKQAQYPMFPADIWALGITLMHMTVGSLVFVDSELSKDGLFDTLFCSPVALQNCWKIWVYAGPCLRFFPDRRLSTTKLLNLLRISETEMYTDCSVLLNGFDGFQG